MKARTEDSVYTYDLALSIVPEQSKAVAEPLTGSWPGVVTFKSTTGLVTIQRKSDSHRRLCLPWIRQADDKRDSTADE
ncbi:hypothetical protein TMatcc_000631 [Talaromyces marneffei ATCC 18224]